MASTEQIPDIADVAEKLQRFVDRASAQSRWSATRVPCGAKTSTGHPCGRAAGHGSGGCVCVCRAERALETIGAHAGSVAS